VPDIPYYISPTQVTNNTTATISVRARGMYGNCTYTVDFPKWYWFLVWYQSGDTVNTSTSAAVTWSRADKYVQLTANVSVPTTSYYGPNYSYVVGARPSIRVTNPTGASGYWTGGHPQVLPVS
jgi:hypothetical protein